jgi:hypothetical protein
MNLARHASVLWRFRRITFAGVILAIVLAVLASYRVSSSGLEPRGVETWNAVSQILVTQPGFPEGRVTLPEKQIDDALTADGEAAVEKNAAPKDQVDFADPARLAFLGDLYSKFLTSDEVLSRVPEQPRQGSVTASPFAASQGGLLLPVIQLTTMGPSPEFAARVNTNVYKALLEFLEERQAANEIARADRVDLQIIVSPAPTLAAGRKPTASVLVFMLVLLGTVAVTHLLEALRNRREVSALPSQEANALTVVDWEAPSSLLSRRPADEDEAYAARRAEADGVGGGRRVRT